MFGILLALIPLSLYADAEPTTTEIIRRLTAIESTLDDLDGTTKKDMWDKFASVSTFASGILVGLIGIWATWVYNNRQRIAQELQTEQSLNISRIQTIERFLPHLASNDRRLRLVAFDSIAALGHEEIATKLATHYGGETGATALASLSRSANDSIAKEASAQLQKLFDFLRPTVVSIRYSNTHTYLSSGFFISADGTLLMPWWKRPRSEMPQDIAVSIPEQDGEIKASIVKQSFAHHLAVGELSVGGKVVPLVPTDIEPELHDQVVALGFSMVAKVDDRPSGVSGSIVSIESGKTGATIACTIRSEAGMAGSPVINMRGQLVGMIDSRSAGLCWLVSVRSIRDFLAT